MTNPLIFTDTSAAALAFTEPRLCQSESESHAKRSMLAYEATFFPSTKLSKEKHRIAWFHSSMMDKNEIIQRCNEEYTEITLPVRGCATFPIYWAYNSVPTRMEWIKMSDNSLFVIEARVSGLIAGGRAALIIPVHLQFNTPQF